MQDFIKNNIKWFSQGCLKIRISDMCIYTDPYDIDKPYRDADYIFITHDHADHFSPEDIRKVIKSTTLFVVPLSMKRAFEKGFANRAIFVEPGDQIQFTGFTVTATAAYNIVKTECHPKENKWVGYLFSLNGMRLYYTSDTELIPEMNDIKADVIFLPMGQTFTFKSVDDAISAVKAVGAKYAVPVHYGKFEGTVSDVNYFRQHIRDAEVIKL